METKLTIEEINLILMALGKLPAEQSMFLILKLKQEYEIQNKVEDKSITEWKKSV